jgi:hypothetical protein
MYETKIPPCKEVFFKSTEFLGLSQNLVFNENPKFYSVFLTKKL